MAKQGFWFWVIFGCHMLMVDVVFWFLFFVVFAIDVLE